MVGILLMTHAPLGQAFIAACAHVFRGPTERLEAIDVIADQDLLEVQALAAEAIKRLDAGDGVLVITDVKGGTPSNAVTSWPTRAASKSSLASACRCCCAPSPTATTRSTWWSRWRWPARKAARCGSIIVSGSASPRAVQRRRRNLGGGFLQCAI